MTERESGAAEMAKHVYDFVEGNKDLKDLLGGKGANLAEMTRMGLPVPPGFTITTEACREYLRTGSVPAGLFGEVEEHLRAVQARLEKRLGDPRNPLLLSVRSGRQVLHARHDGDDPRHRPERLQRRWASPRRAATSVSPGTRTGG